MKRWISFICYCFAFVAAFANETGWNITGKVIGRSDHLPVDMPQ